MLMSIKSTLKSNIFKARAYLNSPFKDVPEKPLWREQLMDLPLPHNRYVIFFLPRSGSSRLTDLLKNAGGLGSPGEAFNPQLIRKSAIFLGAQNLDDYLDLLMRRKTTEGTFGCQITIPQLYRLFFSEKLFFDQYQPTSSIFLVRENIVEQSVSLSRMNQTNFAHSTPSSNPPSLDYNFEYRPAQIRKCLNFYLRTEKQLERMFFKRGIKPLRLSYEILVTSQPERFVPLIAKHVGATPHRIDSLTSEHRKIGDPRNEEFAVKFIKENRALISKVEKERAFTLNELAKNGPIAAKSS